MISSVRISCISFKTAYLRRNFASGQMACISHLSVMLACLLQLCWSCCFIIAFAFVLCYA